jgi:hypothetical protein
MLDFADSIFLASIELLQPEKSRLSIESVITITGIIYAWNYRKIEVRLRKPGTKVAIVSLQGIRDVEHDSLKESRRIIRLYPTKILAIQRNIVSSEDI